MPGPAYRETSIQAFYHRFFESSGPEDVMEKIIKRDRSETLPDQWTAQILVRVLMKRRVIFVTEPGNHRYIRDMYLTPASTIEEALKIAGDAVGPDPTISLIPDGVSVIAN